MTKLDVTLVQTELAWEDPAGNLEHFEDRIASLDSTDLIVLPEMFSTGFSMNSAVLAETMQGDTVDWMKTMAARTGACICGSAIIREGDDRYNRFLFVDPQGTVRSYDKRHLFRMSTENQNYTAGSRRPTIEQGGFRIFPQVCYDLRFPVYSRNDLDFDLIIYVANWPAARREHWKALLKARAIENLCYVVGVNRLGVDGNGIEYAGDSVAVDFCGVEMIALEGKDRAVRVGLDKGRLDAYREQFPAWKDRDAFTLL